MCGLFGRGPKPAPVVDYAAQQAEADAKADAKAAQRTNAKLAARNKRRASSLLATGAGDTALTGTTPAKTVLGA